MTGKRTEILSWLQHMPRKTACTFVWVYNLWPFPCYGRGHSNSCYWQAIVVWSIKRIYVRMFGNTPKDRDAVAPGSVMFSFSSKNCCQAVSTRAELVFRSSLILILTPVWQWALLFVACWAAQMNWAICCKYLWQHLWTAAFRRDVVWKCLVLFLSSY